MQTRAVLALSVAGILVTGSAALAVNTQVLNTTPAGTGNANSVLLPNNSGGTPAQATVVSTKTTPDVTGVDDKRGTVTRRKSDAGSAASLPSPTVASQPDPGSAKPDPSEPDPDSTVSSQPGTTPAVVPVQPGDDKGGLRTLPEPGDDQGRQRKASAPGEDSGGHGSDD